MRWLPDGRNAVMWYMPDWRRSWMPNPISVPLAYIRRRPPWLRPFPRRPCLPLLWRYTMGNCWRIMWLKMNCLTLWERQAAKPGRKQPHRQGSFTQNGWRAVPPSGFSTSSRAGMERTETLPAASQMYFPSEVWWLFMCSSPVCMGL